MLIIIDQTFDSFGDYFLYICGKLFGYHAKDIWVLHLNMKYHWILKILKFYFYSNHFFPRVFYSQHVSFYFNHFFPPVSFNPNMSLFISITFFHPCVLFPTCFFLFQSLFFHTPVLFESFSTHVFYSQHVFLYLEHFFPPMCFIPNMFNFI